MTTTATYSVTGMTCEHCVRAVTEEVSSITGVRQVSVELHPSATSAVTVTSDQPLEESTVRAAVDEAGYELV